jgi:hypothetical protein
MQKFLKDNIAIVAAIILPLILALIFMVSTVFVRVTVDNPQHDFFIASNYYDSNDNNAYTFTVVGEKLVVSYHPQVKNENGYYTNTNVPRLWRVDVPGMGVEEIPLREPADKKAGDIAIPGVTDIPVKNIQPGPDGYSFTQMSYYNGSIMSELFGASRNRSGLVLEKSGRRVALKVPPPETWSNYDTHFIGWVTEQQ